MNKKQKSLTNKGFSLVELIIVIAIMAVLVGVLAPQYLKYVNNSRISTDVTNAQEVATAANVAVADGTSCFGTGYTFASVCTAAGVDNPTSKLGGTWGITGDDTNGVTQITLTVGGTTYECYPNPESTATVKGINNTTANGGLKR